MARSSTAFLALVPTAKVPPHHPDGGRRTRSASSPLTLTLAATDDQCHCIWCGCYCCCTPLTICLSVVEAAASTICCCQCCPIDQPIHDLFENVDSDDDELEDKNLPRKPSGGSIEMVDAPTIMRMVDVSPPCSEEHMDEASTLCLDALFTVITCNCYGVGDLRLNGMFHGPEVYVCCYALPEGVPMPSQIQKRNRRKRTQVRGPLREEGKADSGETQELAGAPSPASLAEDVGDADSLIIAEDQVKVVTSEPVDDDLEMVALGRPTGGDEWEEMR
mmetsp:Transcript_21867/g.67076  ORF Transcript_21867/g.67076 Transcript_21867/m.67076 type:complete len:276 (-) Transcript_21867:471-1298(-)